MPTITRGPGGTLLKIDPGYQERAFKDYPGWYDFTYVYIYTGFYAVFVLERNQITFKEDLLPLIYIQGLGHGAGEDYLDVFESAKVFSGSIYGNTPPNRDVLQMNEGASYHLIRSRLNQSVLESLSVSDSIVEDANKNGKQKVKISDSITIGLNLLRNIVDTVTFIEHAVCYIPNVNWSDSGTYVPAPSSYIVLSDPDGDSPTLTIRAPMFGDTTTYYQTRIERTTRGGDLEISNDPMWPNTESFHFEYEYLSGAEAAALLTFLSNTLGRHIQLANHYGQTLIGYLMTPKDEIVQPKVNGFSAKFDFQIKEG